jgi:hypothetical protein
LSRWAVSPICAKGVDVRDNLLHSITIWRLRKEETSGKRNYENEEKKEETNLIHMGGGRRIHCKRKMIILKKACNIETD